MIDIGRLAVYLATVNVHRLVRTRLDDRQGCPTGSVVVKLDYFAERGRCVGGYRHVLALYMRVGLKVKVWEGWTRWVLL